MLGKKARRLPDILTENEQSALLSVGSNRYPSNVRRKAMLSIMLGGGLRCEEVVSLKIGDLDWQMGKLHIKNGKGAKDRVLWLNPGTLDYLRRWRERRGTLLGSDSPSEHLFTTLKGKALHPSYLRQMVPLAAQKAGITKRVYPHLLRHTFASWLYKASRNLRLVQEALGHSSIQTTEIYTHLVNDELEEALRGYRVGGSPSPQAQTPPG